MKLTLRREPLAELVPAELAAIAGGQAPTLDSICFTAPIPTQPVRWCLK
jgi:hypothetical protein